MDQTTNEFWELIVEGEDERSAEGGVEETEGNIMEDGRKHGVGMRQS